MVSELAMRWVYPEWGKMTDMHYRDPRLWISPEYGDGHPEDVHNHRRCQVGTDNGRLVQDYDAGYRCFIVAAIRHKI